MLRIVGGIHLFLLPFLVEYSQILLRELVLGGRELSGLFRRAYAFQLVSLSFRVFLQALPFGLGWLNDEAKRATGRSPESFRSRAVLRVSARWLDFTMGVAFRGPVSVCRQFFAAGAVLACGAIGAEREAYRAAQC
jgi:hypothetical protein